jgi:hypothetical protein
MASQGGAGLRPCDTPQGNVVASAPPLGCENGAYFGFAVFVSTLTAGAMLPFVMSTWTAGAV